MIKTGALPSIGPELRPDRETLESLNNRLETIFSETKISPQRQTLLRSLIYLWHDYLDESHSISQNFHSSDGSFLHGIMHRREPDYGNAKYWFRRAGKHPCFPTIAVEVAVLLADENFLKPQLLLRGEWDPFGFVDACETALRGNDPNAIAVLQAVQEIEFKVLLDHFLD